MANGNIQAHYDRANNRAFEMWPLVALVASTVLVADIAADAQPPFPSSYDATLAEQLALFNAAVFQDDPSNCVANIANPADEWRVLASATVACSLVPDNTCRYAAFRSAPLRRVMFVFRGSVGLLQLPTEGASLPMRKFDTYGAAQTYWVDAFDALWPDVERVLNSTASDGFATIITGYSLGGAIAALTALRTTGAGYRPSNNTLLLTFGEPRVGDPAISDAIEQHVPNHYRVVNSADPIPHYPPCISIGALCLQLSFAYYHHPYEVWYPQPMTTNSAADNQNYIIPQGADSPMGSDSLILAYNSTDHLGYFGRNLEDYANANCTGS